MLEVFEAGTPNQALMVEFTAPSSGVTFPLGSAGS